MLGCSVLVHERVKFISRHIMSYYTTDRGDVGDYTWRLQQDNT